MGNLFSSRQVANAFMQVEDDTGAHKKDVFGRSDVNQNQWAVGIHKRCRNSANQMHKGASLSQSSRNSVATSGGGFTRVTSPFLFGLGCTDGAT